MNSRALLASLHAAAVKGASPFERTRRAVAEWMEAAHTALDEDRRCHVIALGKASRAMMAGALQALGDAKCTIVSGVVVSGETSSTESASWTVPPQIVCCTGDHPVPGPASLEAADAIGDVVLEVQAGDTVVVLLSGGTTALAAAPVPEFAQRLGDVEVAQARIANLADTLLESGLAIHEMNAIRRRVLRWGAGRLAVALAAHGAARIPVFAISDVIGDDPAVIGSGPCTADPFDESYFLALLDAHDVRGSLEHDMSAFLGVSGGERPPRVPPVDHEAFGRVEYMLVASNRDAVDALAAAAREQGIEHVLVEPTPLQGEAAELGDSIARRALRVARSLPPSSRALYVMGGEPVVHLRATYEQAWRDTEDRDEAKDRRSMHDVDEDTPPRTLDDIGGEDWNDDEEKRSSDIVHDDDEPMAGGRMQVLALAASLTLEAAAMARDEHAWRIRVLAAGTDGRDGPTDAAGAIVDASIPGRARMMGRQPERDLLTGRSWFSLDRAEALLRTGPTGTNVMDVVAVLIDNENARYR